MMQFNVNGQFLELPDNFSIQFKKTNILFAFDKAECERSASFDVPDTPTNNRIFGISKWVQTSGDGMRRRYDAQLQASGVTKDGYLYVDGYSKGEYKAVFVTGDLLGLQVVRNSGKIADIITDEVAITYYSSTEVTPSQGKESEFRQIKYVSEHSPYPSVRLHTILYNALHALGVNASLPATTGYIRYIPDELRGFRSTDDNFTGTAYQMSTTGIYPVCYGCILDELQGVFNNSNARVRRVEMWGGGNTYTGYVRQLVCRQQVKITFPSYWDDDLFVGYFIDGDSQLVNEFQFYGDRTFDEDGQISGESLKGRTITVERNSAFAIISVNDYVNQQTSSGLVQGWAFNSKQCGINIEGGEIEVGAIVRLSDNMPDIGVVELLKSFAALSGLQLNYTKNDGVTFDALNFETWNTKELQQVIDIQNIQRKFSDYAQHNLVQFNSGDMPEAQRIITDYFIQNDNIEAENELQKLPWSEGENAGEYGSNALIKANSEAFANADTNAPSMLRVGLPKNANLQTLCDASTSVQVRARMTLLEFDRITPKTLIYYAGVRYVWTEAQWSKGVMTLKLSKT